MMVRAKNGGAKEAAPAKFTVEYLFPAIKGVLLGVIYTIAIILLFALIIKLAGLGAESIPVVNQIIKITAIAIAVFSANKKKELYCPLRGLFTGILYTVVGYLVFSLIDGQFGLVPVLLSDFVMSAVIGLILGFIVSKSRAKSAQKA